VGYGRCLAIREEMNPQSSSLLSHRRMPPKAEASLRPNFAEVREEVILGWLHLGGPACCPAETETYRRPFTDYAIGPRCHLAHPPDFGRGRDEQAETTFPWIADFSSKWFVPAIQLPDS